MTTVTVFSLFFLAVIIFAIINLFLWGLEFFAATIKWLISYFLSRPHNWQRSYLDIRILFTKVLLRLSFAMLSPHSVIKHEQHIKNRYQRKVKKDLNKTKDRFIQKHNLK